MRSERLTPLVQLPGGLPGNKCRSCAWLLVVLCVFIPWGMFSAHPDVEIGQEAIQRVFPGADSFDRYTVRLTAGDPAGSCTGISSGDSLDIVAAMSRGTLQGYAVVADVRGKDQPITYLLALSPDLVILDLEILRYRESYGYEVTYESWQRQFYGRTLESGIRHGREIRNISGATISSRAVTNGVRTILCQLNNNRESLPR